MSDDPGTAYENDIVAKVTAYEGNMPFLKARIEGVPLRLATPNRKCFYFALEIEKREPEINEWIAGLPEGETFFDIGANNGIYGSVAATTRMAKVVAFEPHFASYNVICRNIYANGLQERMCALPLALSAEDGFGTFYLTDISASKSLNQFGSPSENADPIYNAVIPQAAISTSLDSYVQRTGIIPNHLKIDVDGLETEILRGASETLARSSLKSVCIEVEEQFRPEIEGSLTAAGLGHVEHGNRNSIFFRD